MRAILKSLGLIVLVSAPSTVLAQPSCAEREFVVQKLTSGYGESFQGGGLQSENKIFEVWFSEEKGTWTILMTSAEGVSCVMASGTNWREAIPADKVPAGIPG